MELNFFKDLLFNTINESTLPIMDIETLDRENILVITTADRSKFVIHTEKLK